MKPLAVLLAAAGALLCAAPPRAGTPPILKVSEVQPGMQGVAWTVFQGSEPEQVPVEIIGVWKNAWGPRQDVILAKLGGKAQRTNVAGGMSGSPVYIDGKLVGAIALRLSVFSPDAICGITPIELMLEISDFDESRPSDARTPDRAQPRAALQAPGSPAFTPIETPLAFAGFHENVLREFGGLFQQLGLTPVQGGASAALAGPKPGPGAAGALRPGEAISAVLVSGDMSVSSLGTVTYNDGKRVLAFGHSFFNLGPVEMPIAKSEVLTVLSSQFQPNKFANATEIVGALRQDRHSGILGELGAEAPMIPVSLKVRTWDGSSAVRKEKDFRFHVFVHQKWTPYLMMFTLFNSISGLNDFAEEATYRLSGKVELDGSPNLSLATMLAPSEMPVPAPMLLAGWWGDRFNRLFLNAVKMPRLKSVDATIDLLPARRTATIETAWAAVTEVEAGGEVPVKVFLRPYRGERIEREFRVKLPAGLPKGEHRILLSDADTLNRLQTAAGAMNRFLDLKETVSLLNQERGNDKLYVSLVEARPTVYSDDKTMPSLPASVLNVMQSGRTLNRTFVTAPESASVQMAVPFDLVVSGSQSLRILVK
ncbi:MAG: hypothetical protein HY822_09070 [Acidobacteria bacterium]|nr:hypothetical protein [Acidobacteriota bacterium]